MIKQALELVEAVDLRTDRILENVEIWSVEYEELGLN